MKFIKNIIKNNPYAAVMWTVALVELILCALTILGVLPESAYVGIVVTSAIAFPTGIGIVLYKLGQISNKESQTDK